MTDTIDPETDRNHSDAKPEAEIKEIKDTRDMYSEDHDGIRYACQIIIDYLNTPYKASYSYSYYPDSHRITESPSYYRTDGWEVQDAYPKGDRWNPHREISAYDEFVEECKSAATINPGITVEIIADTFGDDYNKVVQPGDSAADGDTDE